MHPRLDQDARIQVDYALPGAGAAAAGLARRLAYEQTVELPEALVTDPHVNAAVVGRVEAVRPLAGTEGRSLATVSYTAALAGGHLPGLLNLVFGNASLYPGVRVEDLRLPSSLLAGFRGPRLGIDGLRARLGVHGRALLATALKPRGLPVGALADMAYRFALGGGDIVKDDQNLVDDFEAFKARVGACREAVERAAQRTGRPCLYLPHVSAPVGEAARYLDYVCALGLPGVLVCPLILGLDTVRALLAPYPLAVMAHPALGGSYLVGEDRGLRPGLLLGTLFRLAGADASIFPHAGGRFAFTPAACADIRDRLREPLGDTAPAWPVPAGGMQYADLPRLAADYGPDAVFLVGGALLGHDRDLTAATRAFAERLAACYEGARAAAPAGSAGAGGASRRLGFRPGFAWEERPSTAYKTGGKAGGETAGGTEAAPAFRGVRRVELVGKFGERSRQDLRYFEVEPGGFTSRERHVHTHIIIGARGRGRLLAGNREHPIGPFDVAYVAPLEVHQLRNDAPEPFGFFCIVDHARDRPLPG